MSFLNNLRRHTGRSFLPEEMYLLTESPGCVNLHFMNNKVIDKFFITYCLVNTSLH